MGFWGDLGSAFSSVPFVGGIASSITGAIGASQSASAAEQAAALQSAAAGQSNQLLTGAQQNAGELLNSGQSQAYGALLPYLQQGANATTQLGNMLDPNSASAQGFQGQLNLNGNAGLPTSANLPGAPQLTQFQAPNPQDVLNNPAIQFQLQQGQKAVENSAASRGGLNSGATLERVNQYAQGVAAQGYNNVYNQALQTNQAQNQTTQQGYMNQYNAAQQGFQNTTQNSQQNFTNQYNAALQNFNSAANIYQQTQQNRLQTINSALQAGQGAAGQAAGQALGTAGQLANNSLSVATAQGNNLQGAANAQGASKIAGANAWNGALSNIGQQVTNLTQMNQNNQNSGNSAYSNVPVTNNPTDG